MLVSVHVDAPHSLENPLTYSDEPESRKLPGPGTVSAEAGAATSRTAAVARTIAERRRRIGCSPSRPGDPANETRARLDRTSIREAYQGFVSATSPLTAPRRVARQLSVRGHEEGAAGPPGR